MLRKLFTWRRLALILVLVFGLMQFVGIDKNNPESNPTADFLAVHQPPEELALLIKNACYDCHSHYSKYPWYTNVAPVSWWIKKHINEGREHLNFSTWMDYSSKKQAHKLEECAEEVLDGHMPLRSYLWMHPEAKLTEEQRQDLADWFNSQIR